ncbi:kanadaptin [Ceratitis capitata]|uniref:kanadaptin n=1 Tax=Ceratitis capitata TaxID=7213 RepID=UPI00032A3A18|nr:kanadaptin [Ceratitis capitata]
MEEFKIPLLPLTAPTRAEKDPEINKDESNETSKEHPNKSLTITTPIQVCPYKIPSWSQAPSDSVHYKFEVLKSGQIISEIENLQKQAVWKFGRLPPPANDLELAHPTISRFHAILQYRPKTQLTKSDSESDTLDTKDGPPEGWYIFDLNSTHGTFLNKQRIPSQVFIRIRVGHMLRLGASTRSYILQGPQEDEEPESELTITELREKHQQKLAAAEAEAVRKAGEAEERERNEGISWGMGEDADEETDLTHNPFASTNNEELFLDDPKKTLHGYFEREGLQLEYKCDEMSAGSFVCRVELPLDDAYGRPLIAEVVHKGRKKECVVQCALEACRILDRHGVLRQANQEPLKRKVKSQSDSEEDDFLDRTGDVERKKQRKSNPTSNVVLTYQDLLKKDSELASQLQEVDDDIKRYQEAQRRLKATQSCNSDDLDHFMENLTEEAAQLDKTEIRKLRLEQQRLNAEKHKVQRLIKIAKPIDLQFAKLSETAKNDSTGKRQLPMIGKRNQFSKFKIAKIVENHKSTTNPSNANLASDEEEVEDDTETSSMTSNSLSNTAALKSTVQKIPLEEEQYKKENPSDYSKSAGSPIKVYGPTTVAAKNMDDKGDNNTTENLLNTDEGKASAECKTFENISVNQETLKDSAKIEESSETENTRKKRRQRQRQRQKRQEIDIDELEEQESSEKYAKWVPPPNQSGDGYTELNDKYGY